MGNRKSKTLFLAHVGALILLCAQAGFTADDQDQSGGRLSATEVRQLPAAGVHALEFHGPENLGGEIRIRTEANAAEVKIEFNKHIHNLPAGERATRILNSISVTTVVSGDQLTIEIKAPADAEWEGSQIGVRADLDMLVPSGWAFAGESEFYDFDITGPLTEVKITGTYGKIRVDGVMESTELRTQFGSLSLVNARGRVEVTNKYGAITLQQITTDKTPLQINTQYGAVDATKIAGPVDMSLDTAPLEIAEWTLEKGISRIGANAAPIKVQLARWGAPQLTIENQNARVEVAIPKEFSAQIRLAVGEEGAGRICTRGIAVKATRLDRWILEGIAGAGAGQLEVHSGDYGDILLRGPQTRPHATGG